MRYQECVSQFNYSWEQVAQALWQRYPNPQSSHVLSEDTVSRDVIDGKLHSTRLIMKTNRLPKWGEKLVKARKVAMVEHSVVDPQTKVLHTYTTNVGLTKFMSVVERVTYKPSPDNFNVTVAERKTWVDSKIFGLGYAVQKFGIDRYKKNIPRTDQGFVYVLSRLFPRVTTSSDQSTPTASQDAKNRLLETAHRATRMAAEKGRMAAAAVESANT